LVTQPSITRSSSLSLNAATAVLLLPQVKAVYNGHLADWIGGCRGKFYTADALQEK